MAAHLAVHHRPGTFSDRWLEACRQRGIDHTIVDCHHTAILDLLRGKSGLLWHWTHEIAAELLMARNVIAGAEAMGLRAFPSTATCWHFDDKLAQKYLLEAIGAPIAGTHVFYTLEDAFTWIGTAAFPLVFKLRRGAGSSNVRLVSTRRAARALARTAFGRGFSPVASPLQDLRHRVSRAAKRRDVLGTLRRLAGNLRRALVSRRDMPRERGYFLVQEFLPGNTYDTRITVIGDRAFGFTRNVREGDFRASGSGSIDYDVKRIDMRCVEIAHEVARRTKAQSMAFDFALGEDRRPRILEMSYGYMAKAVYDCTGYWDSRLSWHEGHVWPQDAILEDLLASF